MIPLFQHHDDGVIAPAQVVAIEDPGDEAGIAREKTGIASEVPMGRDAVAVLRALDVTDTIMTYKQLHRLWD